MYGIDEASVLKEYFDESDDGIAIERLAFDRLGSHCNILQRLGEANNRSLILERGQPLSKAYGFTNTTELAVDQKLRWIREAAEGLRHIHKKGIIHADFGCSNMILIDDRVKIIDFGGCSIDGSEALAGYNWYNRRGSTCPNLETDIFAYGCAVFEILTGKPPYHEFEGYAERERTVQRLYAQGQFPAVEQMPLCDLILGCWHGTFSSMDDVKQFLDAACIRHQGVSIAKSSIAYLVNKTLSCFRLNGLKGRQAM